MSGGERQRVWIAMALAQRTPILFLDEPTRYSDYLLVMKEGKLLLQGLPEFVVTEHTMKDIYGIEVAIHSDERTGMYMMPIGVK